MKYFNKKHRWASRSIPTSRSNVRIPLDKPAYVSFVDGNVFKIAIFNNSYPYESFFINYRPAQPFMARGDVLPDNVCTYEEGDEHTWDFAMKDRPCSPIYQKIKCHGCLDRRLPIKC